MFKICKVGLGEVMGSKRGLDKGLVSSSCVKIGLLRFEHISGSPAAINSTHIKMGFNTIIKLMSDYSLQIDLMFLRDK